MRLMNKVYVALHTLSPSLKGKFFLGKVLIAYTWIKIKRSHGAVAVS